MSEESGDGSKKSTKKLTLVVDKTRFICNAMLFNQHPNTLLGKMFSPQMINRQGKSEIGKETVGSKKVNQFHCFCFEISESQRF